MMAKASFLLQPMLHSDLDVAEVYEIVQEIVNGTVRNLVETVAEDIAQALLKRLDIVEAVRVVLHKDRGPMAGPSGGYEVEIFRW